MAKKVSIEAVFLLQLGVALFLVTLGIAGITHWNSGSSEFVRGLRSLFGQPNDPLALIVAIVEITAGVVVASALFFPTKGRLAYGLTLIIVEHKLKELMKLVKRVVVLHYGKKIADGAPEEVSRDEQVLKAYLGRRWAKNNA